MVVTTTTPLRNYPNNLIPCYSPNLWCDTVDEPEDFMMILCVYVFVCVPVCAFVCVDGNFSPCFALNQLRGWN